MEKNNIKSTLEFNQFSKTKLVDGYLLSNDSNLLATITDSHIILSTNSRNIINDFFKYVIFINEIMINKYVARAKHEIKIIETRFLGTQHVHSDMFRTILDIDRFIYLAEGGSKIIEAENPSDPTKISPKKTLIL